MKIYIIDDVFSIVRVLIQIIERKELGTVVGYSTDPATALREISIYEPDIVFVDLLMPTVDGISMVKEIKRALPATKCIMISRVSQKEMVSDAYCAGIEFFISKPINIIEVEKITRTVSNAVQMERMLRGIRSMVTVESQPSVRVSSEPSVSQHIKNLMAGLGMLGEKGTKDIIRVCEDVLMRKDAKDDDYESAMQRYSRQRQENVKVIKQRMRRAAKKGLTCVASIGVEDYYNETFQNYAKMVFDFDSIKCEMDLIRGKAKRGGKINLDKFLEGVLNYCRQMSSAP